jgi:sensor histidine kinase YesM
MMMQPFVENSIWHGFDGEKSGGVILIRIYRKNEYLACEVEDNGMGRKNSLKEKDNVFPDKKISLATSITNERITILNNTNRIQSSLEITDLEQGVKILLLFPYIADQ